MGARNERFHARSLTSSGGHYFYGYYDNPAWSADDRFHLCHRVQFWDRIPNKDDVAQIGMIEVDTGRYVPLAETTAWNFQQGSMLQWNPRSPRDEIIYNSCIDGEYRGVVLNIHTGRQRLLERPVVNVDAGGKHALSINFNLMYDFRPGYGYPWLADQRVNPKDDGVFLMDLETGVSRLVLSLEQIRDFTQAMFPEKDTKLLINHVNFNTDGTRFVMLVRNFPEAGSRWRTAVVTADTDGTSMFLLLDSGLASHYHWKDDRYLAMYARSALTNGETGNNLFVLKDLTHERETIDETFFRYDGHCSYSPDRRWMLYDSYPDKESYRHLYLYDLDRRSGHKLGSYYSEPAITGDYRCDLHPRWNRSGTAVSFDSIHEGRRSLYIMSVEELVSENK